MQFSKIIFSFLLFGTLAQPVKTHSNNQPSSPLVQYGITGCLGILAVTGMAINIMFVKDMIEEAADDYYSHCRIKEREKLDQIIESFASNACFLTHSSPNREQMLKKLKCTHDDILSYVKNSHLPKNVKKIISSTIKNTYITLKKQF